MKILLIITSILVIVACNNNAEKKQETVDTSELHRIKDSTEKSIDDAMKLKEDSPEAKTIMDRADQIALMIYKKDFAGIAPFVSEQGLKISNAGFIDSLDIVFPKNKIAGLMTDNTRYEFPEWVEEPRKITFREFHSIHYNKDFTKAGQKGFNKLLRGNTPGINNTEQYYPQGAYVAYFFPAPNQDESQLDWDSLFLIFTKENGEWKLRNILRDFWTP